MSTKTQTPPTRGRKPIASATATKPAPKPKSTRKTVAKTVAKITAKTKATPTPALEPAPAKKRAAKGMGYQAHAYERVSETFPCIACGDTHVHSKRMCSTCYNLARKPMKDGERGLALVRTVRGKREKLGVPVVMTPALRARDRKLAKEAASA